MDWQSLSSSELVEVSDEGDEAFSVDPGSEFYEDFEPDSDPEWGSDPAAEGSGPDDGRGRATVLSKKARREKGTIRRRAPRPPGGGSPDDDPIS